MLFHTPQYFVFLAVVLVLYFHLNHRNQNLMLLGASIFFYCCWDYRFVSLLLASCVLDFWAGRYIYRARLAGDRAAMKRGLLASLTGNLGMLAFFKYFGFFVSSADSALRAFGFTPSLPVLNIVLPVGISFYTFQTLSYAIDIYRGQLDPVDRFLDFALFVAFFPHMVAGPIMRAVDLLPQMTRPRVVTQANLERGLLLFGMGLLRKVAIADPAGMLADGYFANPSSFATIPLVCGLVLYGLQIYNDFAGYSDMARGAAWLLGFDLMRNFRHPYFAKNIADFWKRWHISLSTWLRDYLYIPLGGNRKGAARTTINLFLTMLLGGLWHGASWNFVIWGGLHGTYLAAYHMWRRWRDSREMQWKPYPLASRVISSIAVYALVTFAWLFFRAHDSGTTIAYLSGLSALSQGGEGALLPVFALWGLTLAIDLPQAVTDDELFALRWAFVPRAAAVAAACLVILFSGQMRHEPFIYFQF
jgi:alginate O-acetyltransferase complex protein AlgI